MNSKENTVITCSKRLYGIEALLHLKATS